MNKWRLLLFSVFGLLQITTSDRNFINGRYSCCDHSSRYSESDTRISIYEPYRVNRILPDFETRKSSETRPQTRAQELKSSSRRDINNREHLRRINEDHQNFERQHIRESTNDLKMTQRRDFSRERNFEYSRITRDNTRQERSVRNRDGVFTKDSRSEVASRNNYRYNNERERFANNGIRQDGFNYRRRFARNFVDDRISTNSKSENNPHKLERRNSETSRIAKKLENRIENRNTINQHVFNDEARKIDEIRYQYERFSENDEVKNTRNERFVREYRNKEDSYIENRMRSNLRNNKNGNVLNKVHEHHINTDGLTERNIRLNKRSASDEHINYVRESILGDENSIRNNRQRDVKRNLIMSRRSISEESQRYRDENRERERAQKNINENRNRVDSRNMNREDLRRNRDENLETRRVLGKNSARIRTTTIHNVRDDVKNINRENSFSQRNSQVRRQDTRLETSNMNERHIRNSRTFRQIQERDRGNLRESRNVRIIESRDNGKFKEQADARGQRRVRNIHSEERNRVYNDDRRGSNFIQNDIEQHRRQDIESSRMRSISASRRIVVDRAIDNIDEQLRQTRLQNTQQRRHIRRQDRDVSRTRSISASRHYDVQNMVNEELQRIRSRSMEERSIRKHTNDNPVRSNDMANSYDFRKNLDEIRQLNRYSRVAQTRQNLRRDNRVESRVRSIRVLNVMENREEEHQSRSRPSLERLSIRQNDRNILTSRSANFAKSYATSNSRDNIRDEIRSGDIEKNLNRYSRDTQTRQNIRRDNRDESRVRSVRVLNVMENREERRSRSQPSLESLSIRQNDRNILRSRSTNLPISYASRNNRDNVRDEVRSDDIEKSFSYKRDIVRTRSTPILKTFRTSENADEGSRRTATENTLKRPTKRIGSDNSEMYNTRSLQTYISQNGRINEATRQIRSRSLTTERRTENRQVRINRDRSLNERTARIERDDERRDTRRVPLIAATRSTLFGKNIRDIPITHKTKTASYIFEMKWQYIFYALQGIYICSLFMKMPHNQEKKQHRIINWLTPVNYMKID